MTAMRSGGVSKQRDDDQENLITDMAEEIFIRLVSDPEASSNYGLMAAMAFRAATVFNDNKVEYHRHKRHFSSKTF